MSWSSWLIVHLFSTRLLCWCFSEHLSDYDFVWLSELQSNCLCDSLTFIWLSAHVSSTSSDTLSSWLWYLTFWLTKSKQLLSFWLISFIHVTALPCQSSSLLGPCLFSSLSFWSVAIHSGWLCHWTFQQIFVALFIFFSFLYRII